MGSIKLSKDAAQKAIIYSREAHEKLTASTNIMNDHINKRFIGLKDPTYISYLELSVQMQDLLGQVGQKMDSISEYCEKIINWIDTYNED